MWKKICLIGQNNPAGVCGGAVNKSLTIYLRIKLFDKCPNQGNDADYQSGNTHYIS